MIICPGCGKPSRTVHPACERRAAPTRRAAQGRAREGSRWCELRGKDVPTVECVNFCPAPEHRPVCMMESAPAIARMTQQQRDGILRRIMKQVKEQG